MVVPAQDALGRYAWTRHPGRCPALEEGIPGEGVLWGLHEFAAERVGIVVSGLGALAGGRREQVPADDDPDSRTNHEKVCEIHETSSAGLWELVGAGR